MLGWPSNGERPRQAGHTPYCFPQLVGNRSALRGAGTTLHRLGGAWTICNNVRVTLSGLRFTSSTASTAPSLITRYHAPRRNLTLTSVCSLAHCWSGIGGLVEKRPKGWRTFPSRQAAPPGRRPLGTTAGAANRAV